MSWKFQRWIEAQDYLSPSLRLPNQTNVFHILDRHGLVRRRESRRAQAQAHLPQVLLQGLRARCAPRHVDRGLHQARPRPRPQTLLARPQAQAHGLIKKLRKAKKEAPANEKPAIVKTHLRDMLVVPEMCGSQIGVYSGKVFNTVDIKPEMIGHYLGEFSMTYRPTSHGRAGLGATSSRFIPLK
ncbi:hypothetical protein L7F22_057678 [Adiantum nelumboides]|nr:hypothetical protein [Adiantum nelumboides]